VSFSRFSRPARASVPTLPVTIAIGKPQSPTWFWRITLLPSRSSTRAIASPMIVERRCPTCICLARFTPNRSTTTVSGLGSGSIPSSAVSRPVSSCDSVSARKRTLMNPGPAIDPAVTGSAMSPIRS
jgi:hypothetical protein